jgi:hypothetical protein
MHQKKGVNNEPFYPSHLCSNDSVAAAHAPAALSSPTRKPLHTTGRGFALFDA